VPGREPQERALANAPQCLASRWFSGGTPDWPETWPTGLAKQAPGPANPKKKVQIDVTMMEII